MNIPADIIENSDSVGNTLPIEAQWLSSLIVSSYLKGEWKQDITQASMQMAGEHAGYLRLTEQEIFASLSQFFKGLQAYYDHPYQRIAPEMPLLWQEGSTRLLDYGAELLGAPDTPLVLFIPSLINRSYILDLHEKRSLLHYMKSQQIHAYLIDWGEPLEAELGFSCEDYIARIAKIIALLAVRHGRKITLAGYCMGGLMALASTRSALEKIEAVALLATPWDFHSTRLAHPLLDKVTIEALGMIMDKMEKVPKHLIQAFFYNQNPQMVHNKFAAFTQLDPASPEAQEFVAVERWVSDGISVTSKVAKECLIDWGYHNVTMQGKWTIAGKHVDLSAFPLPTFIAVAEYDHIVPPASAYPLAALIPNATLVSIPAGHVGMIIGRTAKQHLWVHLTDWLRRNIN